MQRPLIYVKILYFLETSLKNTNKSVQWIDNYISKQKSNFLGGCSNIYIIIDLLSNKTGIQVII